MRPHHNSQPSPAPGLAVAALAVALALAALLGRLWQGNIHVTVSHVENLKVSVSNPQREVYILCVYMWSGTSPLLNHTPCLCSGLQSTVVHPRRLPHKVSIDWCTIKVVYPIVSNRHEVLLGRGGQLGIASLTRQAHPSQRMHVLSRALSGCGARQFVSLCAF